LAEELGFLQERDGKEIERDEERDVHGLVPDDALSRMM
jgi:hypothetical protein